MSSIPPDLRFMAALGLLGVVMLTIGPKPAFWLGVAIVLAALTYAETHAKQAGHSFVGDVQTVFMGGTK